MPSRFAQIEIDVPDPGGAAEFWAALLGWSIEHASADYAGLRAPSGRGPWLEFVRDPAVRQGRNRLRPVLLAGDTDDAIGSADPEGNDIVLLA
ncbi:VOC family protein [Amycolatopsis palatopharyngis]|uniref:VOC family protein n=1 Tax=Amycolatopsis palatopharyngis TaxID=187982 RepID=UPI000E26A5AB|nr:VOC family protein [Amycolatopsis palatopharyngis]